MVTLDICNHQRKHVLLFYFCIILGTLGYLTSLWSDAYILNTDHNFYISLAFH